MKLHNYFYLCNYLEDMHNCKNEQSIVDVETELLTYFQQSNNTKGISMLEDPGLITLLAILFFSTLSKYTRTTVPRQMHFPANMKNKLYLRPAFLLHYLHM